MHAALWTTPEAEREEQPQRHATMDVWLVTDGRVDNRDDVISSLRNEVRQPMDTDADLILAAYERWGAGCVDHVVGEVAFAIWDAERMRLLVVRDPIGLAPVFFARVAHGVIAASTLPAVLDALETPQSLDEEYLAGYLAGMPPRDRTMHADVSRLAPGHVLIVEQDHATTRRYWDPSVEPLDLNLAETVEQVRTVFDEAVRCRLRSRDSVFSDLSGGLDSSTVTATAASMTDELRTVTLDYRASSEAHEIHHVQAVADHLDIEPVLIDADRLTVLDAVEETRAHKEPMFAADATGTAACLDTVSSTGCSVSLKGVGGDEALFGSDMATIDLARRFHLRTAWAWARVEGRSASDATKFVARAVTRDVAGEFARELMEEKPNAVLAKLMKRRRARLTKAASPWLTTAPAPAAPLRLPGGDFPRATADRRYLYTHAPWSPPGRELTNRLASERGVEVRYPFLDRRFVELMLRIPDDRLRPGGEYRGLHRLAFGDRMPASVANRRDKAEFSGPYMRQILSSFDRADAEMVLAVLGSRVDPVPLLRAFDLGYPALDPAASLPRGYYLWMALTAGLAIDVLR
jgi:asparagine synthase (glutamine-hydrolysing)